MNTHLSYFTLEIKSIDKEISRLRKDIVKLTKQKREIETGLYNEMGEQNIEEVNGIARAKLARVVENKVGKRKKKKDKERDGIEYLRILGASDPERCYRELMETQKLSNI